MKLKLAASGVLVGIAAVAVLHYMDLPSNAPMPPAASRSSQEQNGPSEAQARAVPADGSEQRAQATADDQPTEINESPEAAALSGRSLEEYIRELPPSTEDDSAFVEKYAGFSPEQLAAAEDLLMEVLREEVEPWVLERERTGDYDVPSTRDDGTRGYPEWDQPKGRFLLRFREVVDAEGRQQKARFTFPPADYPVLDLRVRERNYVIGRNFLINKGE